MLYMHTTVLVNAPCSTRPSNLTLMRVVGDVEACPKPCELLQRMSPRGSGGRHVLALMRHASAG
jgi:hypothetical protein